jgi:hypothetical protein
LHLLSLVDIYQIYLFFFIYTQGRDR